MAMVGRRGLLAAPLLTVGVAAQGRGVRLDGPMRPELLAAWDPGLGVGVEISGEGGDWRVAMDLGRRIRASGLTATAVGERCHDACLLAVLGAVYRQVEPRTSLWLQLPSGRALREGIDKYLQESDVPFEMVQRLVRQEPLSGIAVFRNAGVLSLVP